MMSMPRYYKAQDCPNCGKEDDGVNNFGARMSCTSWGHNYPCCSDKCGREFLNSDKYIDKQLQEIQNDISNLKRRMKLLLDFKKRRKSLDNTQGL